MNLVLTALSAFSLTVTTAAAQEAQEPVEEGAALTSEDIFEDMPLFEETTLEHPDEILTEAEFAETYVNYLAPPDTTKASADVTPQMLAEASDVELAIMLSKIEQSLSGCRDQRAVLEENIGTRPGSYSIQREWVYRYQNCLTQRKTDLDLVRDRLDARYMSVIEGGGAEGATQLTDFVDKMRAVQSRLRLDIMQEIRLQRKLVAYYNTGVKDY